MVVGVWMCLRIQDWLGIVFSIIMIISFTWELELEMNEMRSQFLFLVLSHIQIQFLSNWIVVLLFVYYYHQNPLVHCYTNNNNNKSQSQQGGLKPDTRSNSTPGGTISSRVGGGGVGFEGNPFRTGLLWNADAVAGDAGQDQCGTYYEPTTFVNQHLWLGDRGGGSREGSDDERQIETKWFRCHWLY